jgi:outer membrane receptor protein involved in Fe transport
LVISLYGKSFDNDGWPIKNSALKMKKYWKTLFNTSLHTIALATLLLFSGGLFGQQPWSGSPGNGSGGNRNVGRFYGKIVDENGKGVGYATVQLLGMRFDTVSRTLQEYLISGQITKDNGDFSLENLPIAGDFTLKVSFIGYAEIEQKVSLGIPGPGGGRAPNASAKPAQGKPNLDKDLGNIRLFSSAETLETVTVTAEAASATLALDRRIFRVDKNSTAAGGTAEDALRNIPSLSVDIDGNVTMRNAAPQIFIDGRPTTLTLDQIAADAIESVEVITNPSAKFDASGGQAGIINIVLKKERRIGYNGNLRSGMDSRGGLNLGGDVNAREGKFNAFISGNFNQRRGWSQSEAYRQNFFGNPLTNQLQTGENEMQGFFAMGRAGLDWFIDNRNTITFSGSLVRGRFNPQELINISTDSIFSGRTGFSQALRDASTERYFRNMGGAILYKRLFPKAGRELTADLNINNITNGGDNNFITTFLGSDFISREQQVSSGGTKFLTVQSDYVDPINEKMKFEAGARAAIRTFDNNNVISFLNPANDTWVVVPNFASQYTFDDAVYAAYGSFSHELPKWGYQLGLRAESSTYTGRLPESGEAFNNDFPLSLFPSVFVNYKLNEEDNLQVSYTRRIQRPNFFQLMPFTDFSDSLNLRRGNPDLLPEFTNSLELSYQKPFSKGHNILASVYYKQTDGLITAFQFPETDPLSNNDFVVSSYSNSNQAQAYGLELILRNTFGKIFELTSNINLYNSRVDASNVEAGLVDERFSWFLKENLTVKLPAQFTVQLSGEYQSRAAFSPGAGSGRWGGGGHWGGPTNTAQGYTLDYWFVDAALRKDLFDRRATLTLNIQDIFRSRRTGAYTASDFFIQDSWRIRNPQLVRLNFSYRFGKMDASLFKRKNTRTNSEGMELMQ